MELNIPYQERFTLNDIDVSKLGKLAMETSILPCLLGKQCGFDCYNDLDIAILATSPKMDLLNYAVQFVKYLLFWYPDIRLHIFTAEKTVFSSALPGYIREHIFCSNTFQKKSILETGNVVMYFLEENGNCQFPPNLCVSVDAIFVTPLSEFDHVKLPLCVKGKRPNAVDNTYILSLYNPTTFNQQITYSDINTGISDGRGELVPMVTYEYNFGSEKGTDQKTLNLGMFLTNEYSNRELPETHNLVRDLRNPNGTYSYSYVDIDLEATPNCYKTSDNMLIWMENFFTELIKYKKRHNIPYKIKILWKPGVFNQNNIARTQPGLPPKFSMDSGYRELLAFYATDSKMMKLLSDNFEFVNRGELTPEHVISLLQHSLPILALDSATSVSKYLSCTKLTRFTRIYYKIKPEYTNFAYHMGINPNPSVRVTKTSQYGPADISSVPCCGVIRFSNIKKIIFNPLDDFRFMGHVTIDAVLYKAKMDAQKRDYECTPDVLTSLSEKFNIQNQLVKGVLPSISVSDKLWKFQYKNYQKMFSKMKPIGDSGGFSGAQVFLTNFNMKNGAEHLIFVKKTRLFGGRESRERVRGPECDINATTKILACSGVPNELGQVSEVITMFLSCYLLNGVIMEDKTPNFTFTYYIAIEKDPAAGNTEKRYNLIYFQEAILNSIPIGKFLTIPNPNIAFDFLCIIVQILANLLFIQRKWRMMHNDLWFQNVLIETLPYPLAQKYLLSDGTTTKYIEFVSNLRVRIIDFDTVSLDYGGVRYGSASKGLDDANVFTPYRDWLWLMWTLYRPQGGVNINSPDIRTFITVQCPSIIGKACNDPSVLIEKQAQAGERVPVHNLYTRSGLPNKWPEYIFEGIVPILIENKFIVQTCPGDNIDTFWCRD